LWFNKFKFNHKDLKACLPSGRDFSKVTKTYYTIPDWEVSTMLICRFKITNFCQDVKNPDQNFAGSDKTGSFMA